MNVSSIVVKTLPENLLPTKRCRRTNFFLCITGIKSIRLSFCGCHHPRPVGQSLQSTTKFMTSEQALSGWNRRCKFAVSSLGGSFGATAPRSYQKAYNQNKKKAESRHLRYPVTVPAGRSAWRAESVSADSPEQIFCRSGYRYWLSFPG